MGNGHAVTNTEIGYKLVEWIRTVDDNNKYFGRVTSMYFIYKKIFVL